MIKIYSPTRDNVVTGNYVTAKRYAYHLQNLGHRVFTCNGFEEKVNVEGVRCAFVLHAEKGFHVVKELAAKHIPVVLVLTGTDLYKDIISTKKETLSVLFKSRENLMNGDIILEIGSISLRDTSTERSGTPDNNELTSTSKQNKLSDGFDTDKLEEPMQIDRDYDHKPDS